MLEGHLNRTAKTSNNVGNPNVGIDNLLTILGLALLGGHAQKCRTVQRIGRIAGQQLEIGTARRLGQVAISLQTFPHGAGSGEQCRMLVLVVRRRLETEHGIQIITEGTGHGLHDVVVIDGQDAEVVGRLIAQIIPGLRNVNFHVHGRTGILLGRSSRDTRTGQSTAVK